MKPDPPVASGPLPAGGLTELKDAIIKSHFDQEDDGIIFGGSIAGNLLPLLGTSDPLLGDVNGTCLPGTGGVAGLEIVYDFKHQERGIFSFAGPNLNFLGFGNVAVTGYLGKARGFANQSYKDGVESYGGYFAAADFGISPLSTGNVSAGAVLIEAAPLKAEDKTLNRNGVFASYFGPGASYGLTIPFVSADIAVTNYTLRHRFEYIEATEFLLNQIPGVRLTDSDKLALKKHIPYRIATAYAIMQELEIGTILTFPWGSAEVTEGIGEVWEFAFDP